MLKILYNNIDITNNIETNVLKIYDRAGGKSDSVEITFIDKALALLDNVKKGDTLSITSGDFETGLMYVNSYDYQGNKIYIEACSVNPILKVEGCSIWRDVALSSILTNVSKELGLKLETYGIKDFNYDVVTRLNATLLEFVKNWLEREGYDLKIANGKMIVYDDSYFISNQKPIDVEPKNVYQGYSLGVTDSLTKAVKHSYYHVEKGLIEYTASNDKVFGDTIKSSGYVKDLNEAERVAKARLKTINRNTITGSLTTNLNSKLSACSVLNLKGFSNYDGKYFISEIIHDLVRKSTTMNVRKLEV